MMRVPCGLVNRPATHRSAGTRLSRRRAIQAKHPISVPGAKHPGAKHATSALAVCFIAAFVFALEPCAPAQQGPVPIQQGSPSGIVARYGNFSIVWPAQPRLVENPVTSTTSAAVYAVQLPPLTFTLSFLQFSSP